MKRVMSIAAIVLALGVAATAWAIDGQEPTQDPQLLPPGEVIEPVEPGPGEGTTPGPISGSDLEWDSLSDDDKWGCEIALCLATPGSPTTYAECVEPITKMFEAQAQGDPIPSCPFVSNDDGGTPTEPTDPDPREPRPGEQQR
jgi:hypothetical protein